MSIKEEIQGAIQLIETPRGKEAAIDEHLGVAPIYLSATENLRELLQTTSLEKQSVLACLGSGDVAFNLLCLGVKNLICFDRNPLAKHFFSLKRAAIEVLEEDQFYSFFTMPYVVDLRHLTDSYSSDLFYRFAHKLKGDSAIFWNTLYDYCYPNDLLDSQFIRQGHTLTKEYQSTINCYWDSKNYYKLQELLRSGIEIPTFDCNLTELPKTFANEKFDRIYLSNILQFYDTIPELDQIEKVHHFVSNDLDPLVNQVGEVFVNYVYGPSYDMISLKKDQTFLQVAFQDFIAEDINYQLLYRYPKHYQLRSFSGVEAIDDFEFTMNRKNGVVVYQKINKSA